MCINARTCSPRRTCDCVHGRTHNRRLGRTHDRRHRIRRGPRRNRCGYQWNRRWCCSCRNRRQRHRNQRRLWWENIDSLLLFLGIDYCFRLSGTVGMRQKRFVIRQCERGIAFLCVLRFLCDYEDTHEHHNYCAREIRNPQLELHRFMQVMLYIPRININYTYTSTLRYTINRYIYSK
jgi:hypothetical protein